MSDISTSYQTAPGLYWRRLDEEVAIYLAQSFETHLLDDGGGQVLEAVQEMQRANTPCSITSLYTWLTADTEAEAPGQADAPPPDTMLMPMLNELLRIGAITTQAC